MNTNVLPFLAILASVGSLQAGWNRLPYAEARPVDLAATVIPGTKLVSSEGIGNASALIKRELNDAVTIAVGRSSAVIQLSRQVIVDTVCFTNDGAEGKITVASSTDGKDWTALGSEIFAPGERVVHVPFATVSAKYLQIVFDSPKEGSIRSFCIFGGSTDKDFKLNPCDGPESGMTINLASAVGGGRAIYAFPTPENVGELNHVCNVFRFSKTRDRYRTVVYDLGSSQLVKAFAASYSQRPVRVEVFAFDEVPEKKDWRGKLTFDPALLNTVKPVALGEDAEGAGHIKLVPSKPVRTKCIVLRFEPNYQNAVAQAVMSAGGLLGIRFANGKNDASDDFTIGGVEFNSAGGFNVVQNRGGGDEDNESGNENGKGNGNNNGNTSFVTANNNSSAGAPYVAGLPNSAAAGLPATTASSASRDDEKNSKDKDKGKGNDHSDHGSPHTP